MLSVEQDIAIESMSRSIYYNRICLATGTILADRDLLDKDKDNSDRMLYSVYTAVVWLLYGSK
jgi:hypothetical protein